jgi:CHAT domain-containing protein
VSHRHLFQALAMDPQNLVGRRNELPAGSVLVEYFVADDALYAFVISASLNQPAVVRVKVTSAEIEEAVADFIEAIITEGEKPKHDSKDTEKVAALGRKLDDWLLEPLRPHVKDASTIIVLPFGQLYFLPFDALVVSEPGQPIRYAVEDFRISIQTATTLEHLLKPKRARSNGTMLAVSNPDGTLPGAQREVARIVKSAMPDAKVLGKKDGTIKQFSDMAGAYRFLHLATHGILDADPRKSYLKLSDGPLTVEQISQLQGLDTTNELVVLSACDTANEQGHSSGDELISLAVAFAMAGSPALVASLWEVSDDSTAELMATFYRALDKTGDRLEALRDAKLNLLRTQRGKDHPFAPAWHWASFQMYGDFRAPAAK